MTQVRYARATDGAQLVRLINEMGRHERLPVSLTEEQLNADFFGSSPRVRVLVAEAEGALVGYALYYECYSSFQGLGLFLEDVFVREEYRSQHIGRRLLTCVAEAATTQGCFAILFNVLDWNAPALDFFRRAGASVLHERKTLCLAAGALRNLQEPADGASAATISQFLS
jgi:ribosomal protein S18 acetylase RimI-like enzyme